MSIEEQIKRLGKEKEGVVIVSKEVFRNLLSHIREDIRKKICSAKDAMIILDLKQKSFYTLLNDPSCKVRQSTKKGKYVLSSVYEEAERLNKQ